jgi:hypothetical protein
MSFSTSFSHFILAFHSFILSSLLYLHTPEIFLAPLLFCLYKTAAALKGTELNWTESKCKFMKELQMKWLYCLCLCSLWDCLHTVLVVTLMWVLYLLSWYIVFLLFEILRSWHNVLTVSWQQNSLTFSLADGSGKWFKSTGVSETTCATIISSLF